jgi:glycosyltransferase involved in cell wall biosynthesis
MKLVILTEIIAPYRIPVFNALARQGDVSPHVIFLSETDPALRQWRVYKDEIAFSCEVLPSWRRRLGKYNVLLNRGVGDALRKAAPDAILCGGYSYVASWTALRWARRNRVPLIAWAESTAYDTRRGHGTIESLKQRFFSSASAFVVPGTASAEYVKSYGVSPELIFTAPNAVDVTLFERQAQLARGDAVARRSAMGLPDRYFLYAGRLVKEKGVFDLLEAYGRLAAQLRSVTGLVFVGDGIARTELQQRAASISQGTVLFPGFAHREELGAYYALADMLVLPTYSDTWGLVVNEAMSCGLPVIATSIAGCTADLVKDGYNGRVVRAGSVEELVSAMTDLASNPEMCRPMGARSRELIESYTPEACAAGIERAALRSVR